MTKTLPSIIGELELNIIDGVALPLHFDITDNETGDVIPLTGYTAKFQIRPSTSDQNAALVDLASPTDIVIDELLGTVDLIILGQSFGDDSLVWGLQLIDASAIPDIVLGGILNSKKEAIQ